MSAQTQGHWDSIVRVVVSGLDPDYSEHLCTHLSSDQGFVVFSRQGSLDSVLPDCTRMAPCVWLVSDDLIEQADPAEFGPTIGYGRDVQVLVVGPRTDAELQRSLLHMGCSGYLRTNTPPETISKAIKAVAAGELWADRKLACQVLQESLQQSSHPSLTSREHQILELIAEGKMNREIAEALHITRDTVRWHIRHLYNKIGVKDRLSAVFFAREFLSAKRPAQSIRLAELPPVADAGRSR